MKGSILALAKWFQMPVDGSRQEDDDIRDRILSEIYNFQQVAVEPSVTPSVTVVRTPHGRAILELATVQGCPIVWVDYVENCIWQRTRFWMNASSLEDLSKKLKAAPKNAWTTIDRILITE